MHIEYEIKDTVFNYPSLIEPCIQLENLQVERKKLDCEKRSLAKHLLLGFSSFFLFYKYFNIIILLL